MAIFDRFEEDFSAIRVLVVDDEEMSRDICEAALRQLGFSDITIATDGVEAFRVLDQTLDIGLIFSDWNMPNLDGIDLFRVARDRWPDVPFVMVSSNETKAHMETLLETGLSAYVLKPYSLAQLRVKVIQVVRQRLIQADAGDPNNAQYQALLGDIKEVTRLAPFEEEVITPKVLKAFEGAVETAMTSGIASPDAVDAATDAVIKDDGLGFRDRETIEMIVKQTQSFISTVGVPNEMQMEAIKLHLDSIRAISSGKVSHTSATSGAELVQGLALLMERTQ